MWDVSDRVKGESLKARAIPSQQVNVGGLKTLLDKKSLKAEYPNGCPGSRAVVDKR